MSSKSVDIILSSNFESRLLKMNLLFILASLSAVAIAVLGGPVVSEDFINKNVIVNVIFYRMLPTHHHAVTVYMVTSGETMVNQDHRYLHVEKHLMKLFIS